MEKIFILGDSISKGIIFDDIKSKYSLCADSCIQKLLNLYPEYIKCKTRFGATIKYAYDYINENLTSISQDYIFMEYGGNDCDFKWNEIAADPYKDHKPNTPLNEYSDAMEQIIQKATNAKKKIILSTIPPIDSQRYFNFFTQNDKEKGDRILIWLKEVENISRWQESYNNVIWKNAIKYKCRVADIRSPFLQTMNYLDYICMDGIHPNQRGQELIYNTLKNTFNI
ncbi:MAG: SGNH/GDSL hydrolase family protein [Eubacteriaceae bacterium]